MEKAQGPNWRAFRGAVVLGKLADSCVIDRATHETGVVSWRAPGGGERSAGLRPRRIDPGILVNRHDFFSGLKASIAEVGIKVPILVWGINGRPYVRYGASRVHVAIQLGFTTVPAILCNLTPDQPVDGFLAVRELKTPEQVLAAFGPLSEIGHFVVDHEKIDAHRAEPA